MITIAHNDYYVLTVDEVKNRVSIKVIGFWPSPDSVPNYLEDWKTSLTHVTKGFTILSDLTEMKTHPSSLMPLHQAAIDLTSQAGYSFTAEVVKYDVAEMQMDRLYKEKMVEANKFDSIEAADRHLDLIRSRSILSTSNLLF